MKKLILSTLAVTSLLQSCGQSHNSDPGTYKNTVKLGKFHDNVTDSTFDADALKDLPRVVDLKESMTPVKNQSDRGTCTFFSTAALLEATIKKDMNLDVNLSEEYLSYSAKSNGYYSSDEGSTVLSNIYAVRASGVMLERDSAYQPSWFAAGLPCAKYKADDSGVPSICYSHYAPDEVQKKQIIKADNISFVGVEKNTNDIIRLLAEEKRPITVALVVNFNGWPQSGDIYHDEKLRQECIASPDQCGGHSVLLTGYDLDKGVFFFKNSWGTEWGHDGYGTMTINTLDRYAESDFYSAKLSDKLAIPANHNVDSLELKSFSFNTTKDADNKLKINVNAQVEGARGHLIYMSSYVSEKNDGVSAEESASDKNTHLIAVTSEETQATGEGYMKATKYVAKPENTVSFTEANPAVLSFIPGVDKSLSKAQESNKALLRTTIYVHTDDSSYKVLKRIYSPIR